MEWLQTYAIQLIVTVVVIGAYLVLDRISGMRLEALVDQGRFKEDAKHGAVRIARYLTGFVGLFILAVAWGIDFRSLIVVAGTAITLLGVALFASWSLLSNVTAYFVLLFHPSFRRGQFVRVIDADNYAEGYIADLSLFSLKLITENRETILYPNNLILGRPTLVNPRDRLLGIGKLPANPPSGKDPVEEA